MRRQVVDMIDKDLALAAQRKKLFAWLSNTNSSWS
jgi:hypothetical protein